MNLNLAELTRDEQNEVRTNRVAVTVEGAASWQKSGYLSRKVDGKWLVVWTNGQRFAAYGNLDKTLHDAEEIVVLG